MIQLEQVSFSGHETFPFRYGWLKKGIEAVQQDPEIFRRRDAYVILGVGRNMVRSIRHWCLATRILDEDDVSSNRGRRLRPTSLGLALFADDGWDPYLEDPSSLWLIHWLLVSHSDRATAWYLSCTVYAQPDFTKIKLREFLAGYATQSSRSVTKNTLVRDVDCFVRTYVPSHATTASVLEDSLDCPLVELQLIRELSDRQTYRFVIGSKPSLSSATFGFALLEFFGRRSRGRETLSVHECLYGAGSPGQAFKLDENSLVVYVEELQQQTNGAIGIDETAGLKQVYCRRTVRPEDLLKHYYERERAA